MTALATTSSQVLQEKYDIFISFRGLDIRYGFLSHLTKALRRKGIDVFVDERLEKGDEISSALLEAIQRSKIALVIFSKDYASSRWCLEELVKVMECKRVNGQIVIPIFYNVDPSHVRHQEGSYADAFSQLESRYNDDMLQVWRSVLTEAANLAGYHHSSNFKNESDLVDGIIEDASKKLNDQDISNPKNRLVGFKENLADIESFLQVDSKEVGVIGIWGKGGAGKTTLARAIFEKFFCQFVGSYFAPNVKEESKQNRLDCFLDKISSILLNDDILAMKRDRPNIQRRLCRTRVLLVLDDVDQSNQLEFFLENLPLGPGSKIIVTSRDKHVLLSGGDHVVVHELKDLKMEESLQLFCRHAFKQDSPKLGYEKLSMQVVGYAKGLPLALKVLGSYLKSREKETWECALKKLRKYPNREIQSVLRMSYDGLDIPEKRTFLDLAFFFKGIEIEDIVMVLSACDGFYVDTDIYTLQNKALITISKDNVVEIHDLLHEMAEEIVREESREHPELRSRLNDAKEIQDVLIKSMGTGTIEGITLNLRELENHLYLSADAFKTMENLRFLEIKHNGSKGSNHALHLRDGLNSVSMKLRYLHWESYPLESLPLGFCAEKLVELYLPSSKVTKLWDGMQDLVNLKIIHLCYCGELKELPDFSMAQNLEKVDLKYCTKLCSVHPSLLSLPKLASLNLRFCFNMKNLHGVTHFKSLKNLELSGCNSLNEFLWSSEEMTSLSLMGTDIKTLKFPIGRFNKLEELRLGQPLTSFEVIELSCLTSLRKFYLHSFTKRIDSSKLIILFDAWRSLEELHLVNCVLSEIPDNISALSMLKILSLRESTVDRLPNSIKHLSKLKEIDLLGCKWLRYLPELPPSITHFYADQCSSLETVLEHDRQSFFFSCGKALKCDMMEFVHFTLMRAIYNNSSTKVEVCFPGSTVPKGFKHFHMVERSITIDVAPSSSPHHLLGFASFCIVPNTSIYSIINRTFHFEDRDIYLKDEKIFPLAHKSTDNVFVWYDPMEHMLKECQRRRFDEGTSHQKITCEFSRGTRVTEDEIKGCGIWPIYASELQKIVQQIELKLENGFVLCNSSFPSVNPNAQLARHQPTCYPVGRGTKRSRSAWNWQNQQIHEEALRILWMPELCIKSLNMSYRQKWGVDVSLPPQPPPLLPWLPLLQRPRPPLPSKIIRMKWSVPPKGWCKVNVGGNFFEQGQAGCGGLIRGDVGEWIKGFSVKLGQDVGERIKGLSVKFGVQASSAANIFAVWLALYICWDLNLKSLIIECDARTVVDAINGAYKLPIFQNAIEEIQKLIKRQWLVQVKAIYWEENQCAHRMAAISTMQQVRKRVWDKPPSVLEALLTDDLEGQGTYRRIVY